MKDGGVWLKFLKSSAWSEFAYGTIEYTYTQAGGEAGATITNIKKVIDISGTKTWVDGGRAHNNGQEITLALTRTIKPVTEDSVWETVTGVEPTWAGKTYTFSSLDRYQDVNDLETEYEYRVEETDVNVTEEEGEGTQAIVYISEAEGYDFTNTEVTSIEATKTWKKGEDSVNATITNASVTFELQRKNSDDTWSAVSQTGLTNPVVMTVEAIANADAWKATWTNLPRYELIEGTPTVIMYQVVEKAASLSDNNLIPADPVVVTAGQPVNIDNYVPVDLTILKVDSQGMTRPLAGATFTIQQIDETASVLSLIDGTLQTATTRGTGSVETGADGVATFTGLTAGYYIVKETKLPDGYILTGSGSFYIAVENGQVKLVEKDEAGGWVASNGDAKLAFSAANETDPATVKVGNDAGYELPSTGGPGTNLLYLLGSMLIMLAGAGFILLGRKKRIE